MSKQRSETVVEVSVGFAADSRGAGVAYAAVTQPERLASLRVTFTARRSAALAEREVAYAALRAVANAVRERISGRVCFLQPDESLVRDLEERRPLPTSLTMPYVALRCSLNRFSGAEVAAARTPEVCDLTARALAEVSLHVAA